MRKLKALVALAIGLMTVHTAFAEDGSTFEWQTVTPESQGMSSAALKKMTEDLASRNTTALIVARNDKIVCEWYAPKNTPETLQALASLAKATVGGVSTAIVMTDGHISLDDKAAKFVPQWKDDPRKSKITIRMLGSHTSGMSDATATDPVTKDWLKTDQLTGWQKEFWRPSDPPHDSFTIARDFAVMKNEPGTVWEYSNPGIAMLVYSLTATLRDSPDNNLNLLLRDRVMRPIGIKDSEWKAGYGRTPVVDGLPLVGAWGGADYAPRAAMRLGRLYEHEGNWDGKQLLSADSVRQTTCSSESLPGICGIGWWSNNKNTWPEMPKDAYWGAGAGHRILLVVPSLNLVAVRFGNNIGVIPPEDVHTMYNVRLVDTYLFKPLMEAITDKK